MLSWENKHQRAPRLLMCLLPRLCLHPLIDELINRSILDGIMGLCKVCMQLFLYVLTVATCVILLFVDYYCVILSTFLRFLVSESHPNHNHNIISEFSIEFSWYVLFIFQPFQTRLFKFMFGTFDCIYANYYV